MPEPSTGPRPAGLTVDNLLQGPVNYLPRLGLLVDAVAKRLKIGTADEEGHALLAEVGAALDGA